jgi:hypothetical protein
MNKTTVQVSNQRIKVVTTCPDGSSYVHELEIRPGVEIPLEGLEDFLLECKYTAKHVRSGFKPVNKTLIEE